jgi:hypothetical protein
MCEYINEAEAAVAKGLTLEWDGYFYEDWCSARSPSMEFYSATVVLEDGVFTITTNHAEFHVPEQHVSTVAPEFDEDWRPVGVLREAERILAQRIATCPGVIWATEYLK